MVMRWTFFYEADFAGELSLSVYIFLIIKRTEREAIVFMLVVVFS